MFQIRGNFKLKIAYTKPSITELEVAYATDAAANGWGPKCYDYIFRFEREFSQNIGTKHAIATSSCTGAMTMGLNALGINRGDEVILADTNWIATAAPIVQVGAQPIFVDILPDTWCIDPQLVEASITSRTKAIIATHLYGNLCEMDELLALGRKYNIPIIEDAAEAIGSVYKGKKAGSMGTFSTFSFHGTKTLTTGEGGMLLTHDTQFYEKVLTISNHGRDRTQQKQFWADVIGHKFKMSNIQAALGCAQLTRIDELVLKKREIYRYYKKQLAPYTQISINPQKQYTIIGAWMPTIVFSEASGITRDRISDAFQSAQIDARVFFWPLSSLPMFEEQKHNVNSASICDRAINLPSYHDITTVEMDQVVAIVKTILMKCK